MKLLPFIVLLSTSLIFLACDDSAKGRLLKVGISPWPGYEPLALAAQKNFFGSSKIRIIRFATPTESYRALRDGIIDVAAFTADEVFHYAEVRDKPRIFLVLDILNGADAIVARKDIKSLDDLKGKRLGVEGSALGDYVMHRALDFTKNLRVSDLKIKTFEINEQERAFLANEIDAAITYEPTKSLLLNAGAHILFDSSQIPNEIVDVLVTNDKTIEKRSVDLTNLSEGWFKALEYIKKHPKLAMKMMSKQESTTAFEFEKGFNDLIIPTRSKNKEMLLANSLMHQALQRLAHLMYQNESLKKEIEVKPLLDNRIIQRLK